jgi:sulfopyruvate decarboxylase subunit beta
VGGMNKLEALRLLINRYPQTPVVFTTGFISRMAYAIRDSDNHFYMVGSMGLAAPIGAGLAMELGDHVVVVDGDGALSMAPSSLTLMADLRGRLPQVSHFVLHDGRYDSTGGQPVAGSARVIAQVARVSGYEFVERVDTIEDLDQMISTERWASSQCRLAVASVDSADAVPPRMDKPLPEVRRNFSRWLMNRATPVGTRSSPNEISN